MPSTYVIFWDMLLLYRKYKAKEVVMLLQEFIEFSTYPGWTIYGHKAGDCAVSVKGSSQYFFNPFVIVS